MEQRIGQMVVLANSKKHGGFCMAGKAVDGQGRVGGWIRPVLHHAQGALPLARTLCTDHKPIRLLDVVRSEWGADRAQLHQRENRALGASGWQREGRIGWDDLARCADAPGALWLDGYSSYSGYNDRIPANCLKDLPGSLYLMYVPKLELFREVGYQGQIKNRARFTVGPHPYNLALTDMVACRWLEQQVRLVIDAYVCISLAVPLDDGYAYKVAAGIITRQRAEQGV